jgi:elongation factor Ts
MPFTAQDVKELRELTGVGMMDCKKALTETDGDMQKAIDWLREKGLAAAQKKAGRIAAEGMAYAEVIDNVGVVVEVNAETDFVAQNEKFVSFVKGVAATAAKTKPADLEALLDAKYDGSDKTVREMQQEMVLVIGENITVRRFALYTTGFNVPYVHAGGKIGVMVNMEVSGISDMDAVTTLGKDIAMQIAAMRPLYLDKADVDQSVIDKEKEILTVQAKEDPKNAGKPDNIIEKMVLGRLNKYYEENCLLQQVYVKGDKITVEQHVKNVAKELGGTITVKAFTRFEKGEGIEKKEENFAEEISKLVK